MPRKLVVHMQWQRIVWHLNQNHHLQFHQNQKGINNSLCVDFDSELSPVSQASDTESKPKRKRAKATNSVLSLNDNLHATFQTILISN